MTGLHVSVSDISDMGPSPFLRSAILSTLENSLCKIGQIFHNFVPTTLQVTDMG